MAGSAFEVVFVCTGNRFRSPLAEALFRRATLGLQVDVSSRGTLDLGAISPLPQATQEALRLGLDLSGHRTRPIGRADLADADLVIGFERMHVVTAVIDANAAPERTFTLPELVRLLERTGSPAATDDQVERARHAVAAASAARRGDRMLLSPQELADPLGGTSRVFRRTADQLADLTERLAARLFG